MSEKYARSKVRSRPAGRRDIAVCICILAFGLFGWRAIATFTNTPAQSTAPALTALVETVTGALTTRIAISDTGAALILIDGAENGLSAADASKIRQFTAAIYPDAPPPTIRQYPFATGTPGRPAQSALIELGLLFVLSALSLWIAVSARPEPVEDDTIDAANDDDRITRSTLSRVGPRAPISQPERQHPRQAQSQTLSQANKLAENNPKQTALIIRKWLRQDESTT